MITLNHYLTIAAVLFCIGLYGALRRRNGIQVLMSIELMLNAVNINLIAFSAFVKGVLLRGQIFAIFLMIVAAAEIGVGLAIVLSIYRARGTIEVDKINLMKW